MFILASFHFYGKQYLITVHGVKTGRNSSGGRPMFLSGAAGQEHAPRE